MVEYLRKSELKAITSKNRGVSLVTVENHSLSETDIKKVRNKDMIENVQGEELQSDGYNDQNQERSSSAECLGDGLGIRHLKRMEEVW